MAGSDALRPALALAAAGLAAGPAWGDVLSSEGHRYQLFQCAPAAFILGTEEMVTRTTLFDGENWTTTSPDDLSLDVECAVYDAYLRSGRWCSDANGVTVTFPGATVAFEGLTLSCPGGPTLVASCPCLPGAGDPKSNRGEKRP